MTVEEVESALKRYGFESRFDSEYNWWVYTKDDFHITVDGVLYCVKMEFRVNYYNVAMIWYYRGGSKCSKFYSVHNDISKQPNFNVVVANFLKYCYDMFRVSLKGHEAATSPESCKEPQQA